jgi:hypothetical protein
MRVDHRLWSHRVFPQMPSQISCDSWVRLRPIVFHVRGTLRIQFTLLSTCLDTLAKAKLGDESTLTGPFRHPCAGKGVRHG